MAGPGQMASMREDECAEPGAGEGAGGGQHRCDVITAEFCGIPAARRSIRREPPPLPMTLVPTEDPLSLRLAEELEYARRLRDLMGDEPANDPAVVARHTRSLQSVDIVGQMIGHIANVVRSSDPAGAVERIGMCELKARLSRSIAL